MIIHDISHNISTDISYFIGCPVTPEPSFDPSKLEYQAIWTVNGKTNNDTDKNVPNLVDASNPLITSNFLWDETSGYMVDGLQFDGVDDFIITNASILPLARYTIIIDFISGIDGNENGIQKYGNWYIYTKSVYINTISMSTIVKDAISISSSGLILTKYDSLISYNIGSNVTLAKVACANNKKMIFRSLAIVAQELDESQTRSVFEYIKTLKANNIG